MRPRAVVVEAASADGAALAVEQANRAAAPFQLVFADCSRPDAGGFELMRRIGTSAGKASGLTVATVSSYDLSKAFVGLREAGLESIFNGLTTSDEIARETVVDDD